MVCKPCEAQWRSRQRSPAGGTLTPEDGIKEPPHRHPEQLISQRSRDLDPVFHVALKKDRKLEIFPEKGKFTGRYICIKKLRFSDIC